MKNFDYQIVDFIFIFGCVQFLAQKLLSIFSVSASKESY